MERSAQAGLVIIAVVVTVAALSVASAVFAPVTLALVVGVVLSPLTDFWERLNLPASLGALLNLGLTLAVLGGLALVFQPIIAGLVDQAPKVWSDMRDAVQVFRDLLRGLSDVSKEVAAAASPSAAGAQPVAAPEAAVGVSPVNEALLMVPSVAGQILIFVGALFFFMMTRNEIYDWVSRRLSSPTDRAITANRLRQAERQVARYFMTISAVNAGLALAAAAAFAALGLPGAALWGVVVFLMNFVVYLGPVMVILALLFAGVAAFDGAIALAPAAVYFALNSIEGQFATPAFLGRTMAVNPLLVFLSIVFGLWLWGPIGGIVAIPALLWGLVLSNQLQAPAPAAQTAAV